MLFHMMDLLEAEVDKEIAKKLTPFEAARVAHNNVISRNGSSWDAMEAALRAFVRAEPTGDMILRSTEVLRLDGCVEACQEFIIAAIEPSQKVLECAETAETLRPATPIVENINQAPEAEGGEEC